MAWLTKLIGFLKVRDHLAFVLWLIIALVAAVGPAFCAWRYGVRDANGPIAFWRHWERFALGCELVYSIGFFAIYCWPRPYSGAKPSVLEVLDWKERCVVVVALIAGWGLLAFGAYLSAWHSNHAVGSGLYLLTLAMMLFGLVDYLFGYVGRCIRPTRTEALETQIRPRDLTPFRMAFWFTDIPVILGFAVLGAYVAVLTGVSDPPKEPYELQALVAGSIAFQLLASIIVFGILFWLPLAGLLRLGKRWK